MLTSDFGNYSEADSTVTSSSNFNSESSDYLTGSEIDQIEPISGEKKTKNKSRSRTQKKVKYWTLPTMSSGTFNPSMLTARQQLQYLAQKSKLGEESDSLELSPLRLDRIKFEEMKSMTTASKDQEHGNNNNISVNHNLTGNFVPSSPSSRNGSNSKTSSRGSKLKEEISSSPTTTSVDDKLEKMRKQSTESKQKKSKKVKVSAESEESVQQTAETADNSLPVAEDTTKMDSYNLTPESDSVITNVTEEKNSEIITSVEIVTSSLIFTAETECLTTTTPSASIDTSITAEVFTDIKTDVITFASAPSNSYSLFGNVKSLLFDYKSQHQKHFENFLKDFAKRLGLSPDDEIVKKKREEIINKGMI